MGLLEPMPDCQHSRTEFMMRKDGVDYVRCVDCDQVFEADDLEQVAVYDDLEEEPRRKKAS
jgi:Zn ribbon nucleic-acid-binding protein